MKRPTYHRPVGHTAYHHVGHTAYHHVGADNGASSTMKLVGYAAVGAGAYHGYRRNKSIGWAIAWAIAAGFFPLITTGIAAAQGFGKRKGK
jgi:hypothetical protein